MYGAQYRGFRLAIEQGSLGGWQVVIASDDPVLTELIADGGTVIIDSADRGLALVEARQFIDTLLEPHPDDTPRFEIGQTWCRDGVEFDIAEVRLDGLEARLMRDGEVGEWIALDPRRGDLSLKR